PLRIPGEPAHVDVVPRRSSDLVESHRRSTYRSGGQRVDRGIQPQRRGRVPCRCRSTHPCGIVFHVPHPRPASECAAHRTHRHPRWWRQLAYPADAETDPHARRLCPVHLRIQLLRPDRKSAGRDHRDPPTLAGGGVLMKVMAQVAMVMNLDKCIGCHTCSVTCKQTWTNRPGTEYVWFNNVETKPGTGYPSGYEDQRRYNGGWRLNRRGKLVLKSGSRLKRLLSIFYNPDMPALDDYYEPWTYDYERLTTA